MSNVDEQGGLDPRLDFFAGTVAVRSPLLLSAMATLM
jgi:hypothetical protein